MNLLNFECHNDQECSETEPARQFFGLQSVADEDILQFSNSNGSFPSHFVHHWAYIFNNNRSEGWNWEELVNSTDLKSFTTSAAIANLYTRIQEVFDSNQTANSFLLSSVEKKVNCKMNNVDFLRELDFGVTFEEILAFGLINPSIYGIEFGSDSVNYHCNDQVG